MTKGFGRERHPVTGRTMLQKAGKKTGVMTWLEFTCAVKKWKSQISEGLVSVAFGTLCMLVSVIMVAT